MRKIKILTTNNGKSEEQIIESINNYLSRGWKIKGNMVTQGENLKIMLQKKK
jgi:hypothetical protein